MVMQMSKYVDADALAKYFITVHKIRVAEIIGNFPKAEVVSREQWDKLYDENLMLRACIAMMEDDKK